MIRLPQGGGPLAVSPDGSIVYIASVVDGIMVVDVARERVLPRALQTGGRVWDMALTPDGKRLFLAMGQSGLKRLSVGSGEVVQISDRVCPQYVELDPQGSRLYVAYQCSGPMGRPGHDSVEIFDARRETSLGIVSGPPIVGGKPSSSPDGKFVMLDGEDACFSPHYDHTGCESVPSRVLHLLRASDRSILKTLNYPFDSRYGVRFLDNSRFVLLGGLVSVVDARKYTLLEKLDLSPDMAIAVAFSPDSRRLYLGTDRNRILVLESENARCSQLPPGLSLLYPADGSFEDAAGNADLKSHGGVRFLPGRVGQGFFLDGSGFLSIPSTHPLVFGQHDISFAFYVKFASLEDEMVLVDWTHSDPLNGVRLLTSPDSHLLFQTWPDGRALRSRTSVTPNTWYHLTVTWSDDDLVLYVNGEPEDKGKPHPQLKVPQPDSPLFPVFLGARSPGHPAFHGWLDELAFYNRRLTTQEVKALYQMRESGPCEP